MAILNITPDSFSDGGAFFDPRTALDQAIRLVADGADFLDIGGESSRPGADEVSAEEELHRVLPLLNVLKDRKVPVPISVDTTKASVAIEAIRAGAEIINDISSCADPDMIPVLLETGAAICIMHRQGTSKTMQLDPEYGDVVEDVFDFLRKKRDELVEAGIERDKIAVDPGIGFGKTFAHNWTLIENMERFLELGQPLLVGHSRKRFLSTQFRDRDAGTRFVSMILAQKGVHILRLHDVR